MANHGYEIIDAHAHIFPTKLAERATGAIGDFYGIPMLEIGTSEKLLDSAKAAGVGRMLVCSSATTAHQVRSINDFIAGECEKHPEFFGLGTLHPDMQDYGEEIEHIRALGLHGIKLHPDFQHFAIDDERAFPMYDAIGEMPILFHTGDRRYHYSNPFRLANVLRNFPKMHAIAAHLGGYSEWNDAVHELAGKGEFLRFDTSSAQSILPADQVRKFIETYGVENCFWGDDFPMWDYESEIEAFLKIGLSDNDNSRIFSENFKEYFSI